MKSFQPFNPRDPITAAKLNELAAHAGVPQSSMPTTPGEYFNSQRTNAGSNLEQNKVILVFATEDFTEQVTDHAVIDDCPSGLCNFVDLIRSTNDYTNQTEGRPFYVHDPIAGVTGSASKMQNDVFHAVFNKNSKRWEVLSGGVSGAAAISHAVVCRCIGLGWYVMELVDDLQVYPPDCDPLCESMSASASESVSDDPCDLCELVCNAGSGSVSDDLNNTCGGPGNFDACREPPMGNGTFVYVYDKRTVPLRIRGMATIAWLGDTCQSSDSASGSASASGSVSDNGTERLYTVLSGEYSLVTIPHEIWECCTVGVTREVRKVACFTFIVEGFMCTGPVDPCGSESV